MGTGAPGAAGSLERFEALLTPQGRELLARLDTDAVTAATALRAGTALRAEYPAELVATALAQHELRIQARAKFGRAGQMFFTGRHPAPRPGWRRRPAAPRPAAHRQPPRDRGHDQGREPAMGLICVNDE
jgi:hypothetical protein